VLTWGEPSRGGDSSSVEDQLVNVPRFLRILFMIILIIYVV